MTVLDRLHSKDFDAVLLRAAGAVLAFGVACLWLALKVLPRQIGA